jgi:hypothetical protein
VGVGPAAPSGSRQYAGGVRRRLAATAAAVLVAGCGDHRTPTPDVEHASAPGAFVTFTPGDAGVTFMRPKNWSNLIGRAPLAGGIQSKTAKVAVWRYPRTEPLPRGRAALENVKSLLIGRVQQRNPSFALSASRITHLGGARGVELTGRQTVAGLPYDVRSAHLFKAGAEVVIDATAPAEDFPRLDRTVFLPLLRSLRVRRP